MTTYTPEEQKANRDKWVAALRSGKYKQGRMQLRNGDEYCCLGVACDLYREEHPEATWRGYYFAPNGIFGDDVAHTALPSSVQRWLGLRTSGGAVGAYRSLIAYNDEGSSFQEIADIIESGAVKVTGNQEATV